MKKIKDQLDDIASMICDDYCKYRDECETQEELEESHCNDCPLVVLI